MQPRVVLGSLGFTMLLGCAQPATPRNAVQVVPGSGLPESVEPQRANNNLDVVQHDGRVFLAFRTAPDHYAGPETEMFVVSSADERTWRFEGHFALGTDLREPQLVSWNGKLLFYFSVLGETGTDFEPQGIMVTEYNGPGQWSEPEWNYIDGFIAWRIKVVDSELFMIGYEGGANIYNEGDDPLDIHWLRSADGLTWEPAFGTDPIVLTGGGSETDWVIRPDGSLVAVVRNEAGDEDGFGSKVCRAEPDALGTWSCVPDRRKFDSPLLFQHASPEGKTTWLVARRNVTEDGYFDLGYDDLSHDEQYMQYQLAYWQAPKRCSLWRVDGDALTVTWVEDLPSRGDTCFPEYLDREDGSVTIYNYSNDLDGEDVSWQRGQGRPTHIYRHDLRL